jgi:hypothetical protein
LFARWSAREHLLPDVLAHPAADLDEAKAQGIELHARDSGRHQ